MNPLKWLRGLFKPKRKSSASITQNMELYKPHTARPLIVAHVIRHGLGSIAAKIGGCGA